MHTIDFILAIIKKKILDYCDLNKSEISDVLYPRQHRQQGYKVCFFTLNSERKAEEML